MGKVFYYILYIPVLICIGIYKISDFLVLVMKLGVELLEDFHKDLKNL